MALAERLLARRPGLPPAHLHLGKNLARRGRDADARAALRGGLAADSDPDVRTRLPVEAAALCDDAAGRGSLFRETMALTGNLVAAASAAMALRAR